MKKVTPIITCLAIHQFLMGQNVGIGTTSPTARMHITVPTGFSAPLMKVETDGNSSPHFIIQTDGKVGIGTGAPSQILDVAGNIQFSGALMPNGNAGTAGQVLVSQGPGNPPQWQSVGAGGAAGICSSPSANYVQKWTGTELCNSVIYDDGTNVGIGTTSPSRLLTVMDVSGTSPGAIYARQMVNDPTAWTLGAYLTGRGIASADNSNTVTGVFAYASWDPANGVTITSNATGLQALGTNEGAGTLERAYGIRSYVHLPNNASGTITNGYAIYARCKDAQNCYGVYVSGDANNTQDWGLYVRAEADRNYIGGDLGIGTTPTAKLDVNGQARIRTIPAMAIPANGQLLTADPNGNIQGISFPGDTTLVLRGDGSWGKGGSSSGIAVYGSIAPGGTPAVSIPAGSFLSFNALHTNTFSSLVNNTTIQLDPGKYLIRVNNVKTNGWTVTLRLVTNSHGTHVASSTDDGDAITGVLTYFLSLNSTDQVRFQPGNNFWLRYDGAASDSSHALIIEIHKIE